MQYGIYSQNEWLFPDMQPDISRRSTSLTLLRKQFGGFQVLVSELPVGVAINWEIQGIKNVLCKGYRQIPVCVNRNTSNFQDGALADGIWEDVCRYRVRKAPYDTYDPLEELNDLTTKDNTEAFFFAFTPQKDAFPGTYAASIVFRFGTESLTIPFSLEICSTDLDEPTLHLTNWFSVTNMAKHHNLAINSPEHWDMIREYAETMLDCHQKIFWITWEDLVCTVSNGNLSFDFSKIKNRVDFFLSMGFEIIEWAPIIGRPSWEELPYLMRDFSHPESKKPLECLTIGRKNMTAFLRQFYDFLVANQWTARSIVHVCDEPKEMNSQQFRILCGIYRKYLPGIKLIDAIEIFYVQDALDIYVPKSFYYEVNRNDFENLRDDRNELWFYTCNMPGGKYLNRFLDAPLLNTRLLHWGNFRYNLTGYLHWGYNQPKDDQDPYRQTSASTGLPAGDTHIVYPGTKGPNLSMRYMQMKAGIEDHTLLTQLAKKDPDAAKVYCFKCFQAFDDYIRDPHEFDAIHKDLVHVVDSL